MLVLASLDSNIIYVTEVPVCKKQHFGVQVHLCFFASLELCDMHVVLEMQSAL